jgi:hypothetical protein
MAVRDRFKMDELSPKRTFYGGQPKGNDWRSTTKKD